MGIDLAEKPTKLREAERTDFALKLNRYDLPWIEDETHAVSLVKMRIGASSFLFGSAIQGKALVEAANQLDPHRSEITNNLLYSHLPQFAEGFNPQAKMIENPRTRLPIFSVGNKGGQRVYFMRFGRMDNMPIIIRIAACDKNTQIDVLSTLTTDSRKAIKQSARL